MIWKYVGLAVVFVGPLYLVVSVYCACIPHMNEITTVVMFTVRHFILVIPTVKYICIIYVISKNTTKTIGHFYVKAAIHSNIYIHNHIHIHNHIYIYPETYTFEYACAHA